MDIIRNNQNDLEINNKIIKEKEQFIKISFKFMQ